MADDMMETANISSELTESGEGRAYPWREDVRVPDPSTADTPAAVAAASRIFNFERK